MSIAVLKNRLLDLTDRRFDESSFGASTTRQLVEMLGDVLALDLSTKPATAILRDEIDVDVALPVAAFESARRGGGWRIRRDLWDAIVDFRSGSVYIWDGRRAVALPPGEAPEDPDFVLPTADAEELANWRGQFAEDVLSGAADEPTRLQVDLWRDSATSSQQLPAQLRNRWFGTLKHHVRARLEEWFAQRAEDPPKDLVSAAGRTPRRSDDVEALRRLVIRAVQSMSRTELEGLSLPVSVLGDLLK